MIEDRKIGILGAGHHLAGKVETNEELCEYLPDITPEWIVEKTGITKRYIALPDESASLFAVKASEKAIENSNINKEEIGLIIACTYTPDYLLPAVSSKIHKELSLNRAQSFDINAACTGFVNGLTIATDRMRCDESIKYALVVGVELQTPFCERSNVDTSIYFSDGAGAVILGRVPNGGIVASNFHSDTSTYESTRLRGGGSLFPYTVKDANNKNGFLEQNGLATWKQAIVNLPISIKGACIKSKIEAKEIDFIVFHQANLALIQYVMKKMKIPIEKTHTNVQDIGNTGAASLAIALSEAMALGKINKGDNVALAAVGAGYTFGCNIWKWVN